MRANHRQLGLWLTAFVVWGCGGTDSGLTPGPGVASVAVSAPDVDFLVGDSVQLTAVVKDVDGKILSNQSIAWTSGDPSVTSVSSGGLARAVALGTASISATVQGQPGHVTLQVGLVFQGLFAGGFHTCGLTKHGAAYCWGHNTSGELGVGDTLDRTVPTAVAGGLLFTTMAAGAFHSCGVTATGAYCWGDNQYGELGTGLTSALRSPVPVAVASNATMTALTGGGAHTCALTSLGGALCWGDNDDGQLGNHLALQNCTGSTTLCSASPITLDGALSFTQISAGLNQTCGVANGRQAYCWGANESGELGLGTQGFPVFSPSPIASAATFANVTTGVWHSCGVDTSGSVYCWGLNTDGEVGLGAGAPVNVPTPSLVGGLSVVEVVAGDNHSCARTAAGVAYCWGRGGNGQLGTGFLPDGQKTPAAVTGGLTFSGLTAGTIHTCGLTSTGTAYCWGDNSIGQLGVTGLSVTAAPTKVAGQP